MTAARTLAPFPVAPDLLELRVDHFAGRPAALEALNDFAARTPRPLIVTVRHPLEGGARGAPAAAAARGELFARFLPHAAWVDLELRSVRSLRATIAAAQARGVGVIASFHDFRGCPSQSRMRDLITRAADAGAGVCKIAVTLRRPGELARLLELLDGRPPLPLALMGMGPLGKLSRLTLAAAGSVFNYGYLGRRPQVAGQWPAQLLRDRIDELRAD